MVQSRETTYWSDFNGGLNLSTATQSLEIDETPDCLNVDFGVRKGFTLRGGFHTQETNVDFDGARFIGAATVSNGVAEVLVQPKTGLLAIWNGGSLVDTGITVTDDATKRVRSAPFNDLAYLANGYDTGVIEMAKWDGTTRTPFPAPTVWNDNYLAPTDPSVTGQLPRAAYIAEHQGFMWVADTYEGVGNDRYPTRVRFSHSQFPEDWAELDWFGVGEPGANDPITGLVPFGSMLLVFKLSSVWAIYGYDKDSFVLERLSDASGTCTCGAIAVNSGVAYWFSTDGNLMAFNGKGIVPLSEPIRWWSENGKIKHGGSHRLMWHDDRLWMSLEAGSGEVNAAGEEIERWLFIWDPKSNSFTRYDRQPTDLISWVKFQQDSDPLFIELNSDDLFRYDQSYGEDTDFSGVVRIDGYYRTAWMTAGETATRKRWKRPRLTAAADADATMRVKVFRDFDESTTYRIQEFEINVPTDATLWGTAVWGTDLWYVRADDYYSFTRLPSSGTAYGIQYEFSSPDNVGRWWVDSIAIPFRRKQVR